MKTTDLGLTKSSRTSRKTASRIQPQTKATNPNLPTPKPTKLQPYPAETQRTRRTKLDICTEKVLTPRSKHLEKLKKIQTKETNPKLPTLKPIKLQPNLATLATKHAESTNQTKKIALPKPTTNSSKPTLPFKPSTYNTTTGNLQANPTLKIPNQRGQPNPQILRPTPNQPNTTTSISALAKLTSPRPTEPELPSPPGWLPSTSDSVRLHLELNVHGKIQIYETECISQRDRKFSKQEKSQNLPRIKKANSDDVTSQPSNYKNQFED